MPISLSAAGATITIANAPDKLIINDAITGDGPLSKGGAGTLEIGDGGSLRRLISRFPPARWRSTAARTRC